MAKRLAGRALVHFPYRCHDNSYANSIILGYENHSNPRKQKYALPGGGVKKLGRGRTERTVDAAVRELWEELHLTPKRGTSPVYVCTIEGREVKHDIFLIQAEGNMVVDRNELQDIGFYAAGTIIPKRLLEYHVQQLRNGKGNYFGTSKEVKRRPSRSDIIIPGKYFREWQQKRKGF